jgi:uncharacterized membrane protein
MDIGRIVRHLFVTHWSVRRAFPRAALDAIERATAASEAAHAGQVRFAVEGALHTWALFRGQSARERALEVFSHLRIWDTEHNNGVLIYLLLADRAVEVVADRGVHSRVAAAEWESVCRQMEGAFRAGRFEAGVTDGILAVTRHLVRHFPRGHREKDELPNQPVVL